MTTVTGKKVRDTRGDDTGVLVGWGDEGAAVVLWDGYEDLDETFAWDYYTGGNATVDLDPTDLGTFTPIT